MNDIIQKISAYDLMNTLIPGGLLTYALQPLGYLDLSTTDVLVEAALAYLLGLIGSRVGSLVLEPLAIKLGLIQHDYSAYVVAQKRDERLTALTTIANMYRALTGSVLVLGILALGALVPAGHRVGLYLGYGVASFVLLLCSWLKQDGYVGKRIELYREESNNVKN